MNYREALYAECDLPPKFWEIYPKTLYKESRRRRKEFVSILKTCKLCSHRSTARKGIILSSKNKGYAEILGAGVFKYMIAKLGSGSWIYAPDLFHRIIATKFDFKAWDEYANTTLFKRVILMNNFDVSRLLNVEEFVLQRLYDIFYSLNRRNRLIIIITDSDINRFSKMLGEELSSITGETMWWKNLEGR